MITMIPVRIDNINNDYVDTSVDNINDDYVDTSVDNINDDYVNTREDSMMMIILIPLRIVLECDNIEFLEAYFSFL